MLSDIIVLRLRAESLESLSLCAEVTREAMAVLFGKHKVTFAHMLYPFADTRNVLISRERGESPLFGTHSLYFGVKAEALADAVACACAQTAKAHGVSAIKLLERLSPSVKVVKPTASELTRALEADTVSGSFTSCGDFCGLLTGGCDDYRIREAAYHYCAFYETAILKKLASPRGLLGGRFLCESEQPEQLGALYESKTGGIAEVKGS